MSPRSSDEAVKACEDRRYQAVLVADTQALGELLDESLVYTHSTGTVDGKASYLAAIAGGGLFYRKIERSEISLLVRDRTAFVFCRIAMDIVVGGTPKLLDNRMTSVWVPHQAGWRLLVAHSTPLR